ncbi:hypothetical protein FBD94_09720 [Pedobacter hiemivivus]|uniref:Uncharacterized protein n=1 Tax=Pedobacter hiemivivus TaxID=2530454 RepID=A0A4U1GHU9_9SPHI|nr:hypothetical protein [Pedobacter hiemivivus]TKC62483.1 hypothetical protein FBD94_09720 [Pedobacter hiemivivus]
MEPLIIRKAALNLYLLLALSILSFLFFVYIFYDDFTIVAVVIIAVVGLFPSWLFIYALRELIQKKPHLTFTENELIVKNRDFYNWENIEGFGFSVEEVGRDNAGSIYKNYVTLSLKDGTSAKIPVSHLDRKADEILYLLGEYKRESEEAKRPFKQ